MREDLCHIVVTCMRRKECSVYHHETTDVGAAAKAMSHILECCRTVLDLETEVDEQSATATPTTRRSAPTRFRGIPSQSTAPRRRASRSTVSGRTVPTTVVTTGLGQTSTGRRSRPVATSSSGPFSMNQIDHWRLLAQRIIKFARPRRLGKSRVPSIRRRHRRIRLRRTRRTQNQRLLTHSKSPAAQTVAARRGRGVFVLEIFFCLGLQFCNV